MKFLERFTLVIYSLIILILSVILSLLIFNWMDFDVVTDMVEALITGSLSSKITLGVCVAFILLSIKCMFFDENSKDAIKETQGILLKNENGQLMISKETIDNMVKNAVIGFENVKQCNTKIEVNAENQLNITLFLVVNENVVIKELASNLQTKIKEDVKKISDLDVQEVNVKVMSLQDTKKSKE
ncbi:MAG: alkaline shock response membrane anchor protein AmaP [Clostridia bacterium]|nr:alkaline shock response membrane anchor protein AmaP [Clostridia bacterium]